MKNISVLFTILLLSGSILAANKNLYRRSRRHHRQLQPMQYQYIPKADPVDCIHEVCNNTIEYPEEYILNLLEKNKNLHKLFGTVIEPTQTIPIANRFGNGDEINLCKTRQITTYPKSAKFLGAHYMSYIVNVKEYTQAITFEMCIPDTPCFPSNNILDYRTFCKQAYNNVRLLYLTRNGTLAYGKFPIPSTCVCAYTTQKLEYDY